jgi:hypothetical protein
VTSQTFDPGSVLTPDARSFLIPEADASEEEGATTSPLEPSDLTSFPRLNEITVQLMRLATSDAVLTIMREGGKSIDGTLQTFPVISGESLVPYITFSAVATSPEKAVSLSNRHVDAFKEFVTARQTAANIPSDERVVLETINQPETAALLEGRPRTRPIVIFLAVMTVAVGLCFVLENLRPRIRPVKATSRQTRVEGKSPRAANRRSRQRSA